MKARVTRESKQVKEGENTKTEFVDVYHKGEKQVLSYQVPIFYFPGGMAPPGQYSFPFSFSLPSNVPATLFFCGLDKSVARIKSLWRQSSSLKLGLMLNKMLFKQALVIRQPNYSAALSPVQTDSRNVYACWWLGNKGQARITTQFEKDGYTPIEVCKAMWDIDNSQCTGIINSISIRLEQYVELRAGDGQTYNNRHILEQKNYDGLGANQSTGGMNRYLELDLSHIKQQAKSFEDGKILAGDNLYLAEKLQPTSTGSIVKLYYQLTVFFWNYGSCWAEEPHWTIPLKLFFK